MRKSCSSTIAALGFIKGRMYDYNNGRFLSVDPFIQEPTSTQSLNPYTYIFNNPLSGTDPTGYATCVIGKHDTSCLKNGSNDIVDKDGNLKGRIIVTNGATFGGIGFGGLRRAPESIQQAIEDINNIVKQTEIPNTAEPGSQEAARIDAFNSIQPLASPVPITTVTSDGQTVNLIYGPDGIWHHVGDNNLTNVNNRFVVDHAGMAHRIPEKGLVAVDAELFEIGSYFAGGAGAVKGAYGLIKRTSSNVLYRVQGGVIPNASKHRIIVGDSGEISIQGRDMLFVNLGQKQRALDFLAKRGDQASLVELRVSSSFANKLRNTAVDQRVGRAHPGLPQKVDPTKAIDQFGIPSNMFEELLENIKR